MYIIFQYFFLPYLSKLFLPCFIIIYMSILTNFVTAEKEFHNFLTYMPNPDYILNSTDETLEIIEVMLSDSHISAKLEELKAEILSRPWKIQPADNSSLQESIANRIKEIINDALDLDNDLEEELTAVECGFSISEVIWQEINGEWIPDSIKGRHQKRFAFKSDGTLMFLKNGMWQELKKEKYKKKFIIFRPFSLNENPYGQSILLHCYWPWKFKTTGWKFWLIMMDRFGVPSILALFNTEEQDEDKIKERAKIIAGELSNLESNSSAALANVDRAITIQNKGASADFKTFIELCNAEISKGITGSTLTSDTGTHGSYAQSVTHADTKEIRGRRIAKKLARIISRTLIKWIVELNWGEGIPSPEFLFDFEEVPLFETVEKAINLGIPVSKRALYTTYNIPEPEDAEDIFVSQPKTVPMNFADNFFLQKTPRLKIKYQDNLQNSIIQSSPSRNKEKIS